jgi:hypothetical protein
MSEHLGEDFLTGMVAGSAIKRQRQALANEVGAAVAAAINPPHELTQEEINALPEDERELLSMKRLIKISREVLNQRGYIPEPTIEDARHNIWVRHQSEEQTVRLRSLPVEEWGPVLTSMDPDVRDRLIRLAAAGIYLTQEEKVIANQAFAAQSVIDRQRSKAEAKAHRKQALPVAVWTSWTSLVSTFIIVLVSFLLWDSFGIAGNEMLFGVAAFIGLLIYMKTEKLILPVMISVSFGLLVSLAISVQDTAVWFTRASGDFDVGLGLTLLGSIVAMVAWGCECFRTAKAQAATSYR